MDSHGTQGNETMACESYQQCIDPQGPDFTESLLILELQSQRGKAKQEHGESGSSLGVEGVGEGGGQGLPPLWSAAPQFSSGFVPHCAGRRSAMRNNYKLCKRSQPKGATNSRDSVPRPSHGMFGRRGGSWVSDLAVLRTNVPASVPANVSHLQERRLIAAE